MKTVGYIVLVLLLLWLSVPGLIVGLREGVRNIKKKPTRGNYLLTFLVVFAFLAGFVAPVVIVLIYS